ncbi:MAG TPA: nucleotide pyrophosphatase/phosphodiesterase family protein [Tepidisphaeraceae bacterium]|nr:nucleotide pyrophosphatase/phosphodiesterase family protein [Tepidisphaeraceae bacterium]
MYKTVVIDVVGLTRSLIGAHTPRLRALAEGCNVAAIGSVLPAVTTTVQATYLTGTLPREHGIVGNGWYFRDECEVKFWRQSNKLVQRPSVWEAAKKLDPSFTCANLFWWYNMYSTADYAVTPRPMYPADGRKLPDVYSNPPELRDELQRELGQFPLFRFWGPATSIASSQWIADAAIQVDRKYDPTLTLIYLPHLDYALQRVGPDVPKIGKDLNEVDAVVGQLLDHYQPSGARVIVLSEYGITPVSRPVHLNRVLRERGLLAVREELGRELLDAGASRAFAVADHQLAHIYVNDPSRLDEVRRVVEATPGVERVLDESGKRSAWLDHPRSGELIAIASPDAWFTYYYWLDEARAPDFATTVDIHRKPGYDPAELFIDPTITAPKVKIATTLLRRKLGFRTLLNVIPTDATLVRGSHGRAAMSDEEAPVLMTSRDLETRSHVEATDVFNTILKHLMAQSS